MNQLTVNSEQLTAKTARTDQRLRDSNVCHAFLQRFFDVNY
jgi:hypothetical protein|tara:strand:+ start:286 stop:408 length:123 start_codon:yes stop_codon:yes gene_type:complete